MTRHKSDTLKKIVNKFIIKFFLLLGLILIAGVTYQFIATQVDGYTCPPPGQLVDVGGYKMHLHCTGQGGPTVILDAAMGCNSLEWSLIQPDVAKITRVCSYDRAGNGWSDEGSYPRTSMQIVEELHDLLTRAKIPGPYILVGHSFGGVNMRLYANRYPEDVIGMVLVDASHEDQFRLLPPIEQSLIEKLVFHRQIARFLAHIGMIRVVNSLTDEHKEFPTSISGTYSRLQSTPKFIGTIFEERKSFSKSLDQLKNSDTHLGKRPLTVITAGRSLTVKEWKENGYSIDWIDHWNQAWANLQRDLTTSSEDSTQIIAKDSGHMITREEPQIVIDAINKMVNKLRVTLINPGNRSRGSSEPEPVNGY